MAFSQPRRHEGFSAGLYVPIDEVVMGPEGLPRAQSLIRRSQRSDEFRRQEVVDVVEFRIEEK